MCSSPGLGGWGEQTMFAPKTPAYRYIILLPLSGGFWGEHILFAPRTPKNLLHPFPSIVGGCGGSRMTFITFSRLGSLFMTAPICCPVGTSPNMGGGVAPDSPQWGGANPVRPTFAPRSPHPPAPTLGVVYAYKIRPGMACSPIPALFSGVLILCRCLGAPSGGPGELP